MFNNDYFCKSEGFVIDGISVGGREKAFSYLVNTCFMEAEEAASYLARILRDYARRIRAVKGVRENV